MGSCPSGIDEAKILRCMEETGHQHATTNHWPGQLMCFVFNNVYVGSTMLYTFGPSFAAFTAAAGLSVYGITLLHKLNKPNRDKSGEMGAVTSSMLSEIFNNIKMIKLYGWQELFAKRMTNQRSDEFDLDNRIESFGRIVGLLNNLIRVSFPTLNLCLYAWNGNTFDVSFAIVMIDYFNRIFNSYNFFPHFLNWCSERQQYWDYSTQVMQIPDM